MADSIVPALALGISTLSLGVSATTAWLTNLRRGQLKMTRPTMMAFVHEGESPKIVMRSMLFSTAHRGNVVESLHATLQRETTTMTLAFWGYGETTVLQRGGGLFVGREGVALYHHFTTLPANFAHKFQPGSHTVRFFACLLGKDGPQCLIEATIELTEEMVKILNEKSGGVMFNWHPEDNRYLPDTTRRPVSELLIV